MTNTKLVADILQNISVQNVNKALVYITDWTSPLILSQNSESAFHRCLVQLWHVFIMGE